MVANNSDSTNACALPSTFGAIVYAVVVAINLLVGVEPEIPSRRDRSASATRAETSVPPRRTRAKDAMPRGGSIVISARERDVQSEPGLKPGRYVCLSVEDTGPGMDEQTLKRAIEPFYTTKGVGKGTGLGLPMVLGMSEQTGGKLYLKSKPGEGTTAELYLPVAPGEDEPEKKGHYSF